MYRSINDIVPPSKVPISRFIPIFSEFSTVLWTQITAAIAAKREFGQTIRHIKTDKAVLIFLDPIWGNSKFSTVSTPIFLIIISYKLYNFMYEIFVGYITNYINFIAEIEIISIKL